MVADLHRNMIMGGVFIYPATASAPNGKLRLVYECNPMAFIIEQAGGRATNGFQRILDIPVESLHQRSTIFIGSENMVLKAEAFMREFSPHPVMPVLDEAEERLADLGVIGGID